MEFEEKVDIDDLVLPSKPMKQVEKGNQHAAFESDHDAGKKLKLKMKENILKLYEELDKEKSENSTIDFSLRRSLKISQFVENIAKHDSVDYQMICENVLLKTKIAEITDEHKIAMSQNTKTINSIVKMHEEAMDDKRNELTKIKQELQSVESTNQELLQKVQKLEMNKNTFGKNDSLERCNEIKPFSCKYCDKSFLQVHEVKEHIKVHTPISKANNETIFSSYGEDGFTIDDLNAKIAQEIAQEISPEISPEITPEIAPKIAQEIVLSSSRKRKFLQNSDNANLEPKSKQAVVQCHEFPKTLIDQKRLNTVLPDLPIHQSKEPVLPDDFIDLSRGPVLPDVRILSCQICDLKLNCDYDLSIHYFKEHQNVANQGGIDHLCQICQKKLSTKKSLVRHLKRIHFSIKPSAISPSKDNSNDENFALEDTENLNKKFVCETCKKVFKWHYNLPIHKRTVHEGNKDFSCTFCTNKFTSKFNLARHQSALHEILS